MVLGHYGLALAGKRFAPRTSLGVLVLAAQLADEVWPLLLLCGVEQVQIVASLHPLLRLRFVNYPITHSLLTEVIGGIIFGLLYFVFRRDTRGAVVTALLVPSHWVLDFLVHVHDLPLWPGGPRVGLGLWHSLPVTLILETSFFFAGLLAYARTTVANDRVGCYSLWTFVGVLVAGYASSILGPPPTGVYAIASSALILWVFVPWAWWFDAHRSFREAGNADTSMRAGPPS
jgi:hypothetical protein